jgi:hypothetical protein
MARTLSTDHSGSAGRATIGPAIAVCRLARGPSDAQTVKIIAAWGDVARALWISETTV